MAIVTNPARRRYYNPRQDRSRRHIHQRRLSTIAEETAIIPASLNHSNCRCQLIEMCSRADRRALGVIRSDHQCAAESHSGLKPSPLDSSISLPQNKDPALHKEQLDAISDLISNVPWLSISHNTHLSGYSSTRAEEGRHSDAEDDELCAVTSTAARDTHGHHAHAYRQGHEDYEMEDSACELTRHVDCMMSDLSIQSVTDLPFDVLDFEESLWDLSSVEDDDFELEVHGELNEVLRAFVLDKRSIVLDSACPELAPHIVITPPTDPWEGCVAYSWNTPQPQDDTYLTIPQRYCVPAYSASYALMEYYAQPSAMHASLIYRPALRLSRFMISSSEDEDDLSGSYRRLYKMATRIAMLMAPEFRARWDVEGFRRNQEKPFVWSDPAIPLLSFYGSCRDTRIIDSVHPFTSPHIVIHEAPDQTPWDACSNRIITPQHCENLMVPGVPCHCPVRVVSTPPLAEAESDSDMEGSVSSPTDESDSEFEPDTPAELGVFRFVVSYDCDPPLSCRSKVVRDFALDEDEDDLPPFDEWYQDIALRMR